MALHDKTIMMIGGGVQEISAVKIAQECGFNVLVTDRSPTAPCFDYADFTATIDGRDIEALAAYAIMNKDNLNIKGVFTLTELVTSVAAVAEAAALPGVSIAGAVACQNKDLSKKIWIEKGIPTPQGNVVKTFDEAKSLFEKYNRQIFVKPMVGFGGQNSRKIDSEKVLADVFVGNEHDMVLEELIVGSMHDVNGLISEDGKFHPMGIVDRSFLDQFPVETGISTPSWLDQNLQNKLYKLLENAVKALGITWGPVKGDAVLKNGEFKILEVAPRLHGPKNSIYLLPFSGFSCLSACLGTICGYTNTVIDRVIQERHCICKAILPPVGSKFDEAGARNAILEKGVKEVLIFKIDNETITQYQNATDVPAYVFATGQNSKECNDAIKNLDLFTV